MSGERAVKHHLLKTWPQFFWEVACNEKRFELRRNDRDFRVNDILNLAEWIPETQEFTGHVVMVRVLYILHGPDFGVDSGHCIMSIEHDPEDQQIYFSALNRRADAIF